MVRPLGLAPKVRHRLRAARLRRTPLSVVALVAGLAGVAVAGGAWSEALGSSTPSVGWVAMLGLLVTLVASAYFHVEFRHGDDDVDALDLFEAAFAPALFLVPGAPVVVLVALAKVVSEALLGVRPLKAAFNVASWSAAAAVGSVVLRSLRDGPQTGVAELASLAVAMVAVTVVNQAAFVTVLRLAGGRTFAVVIAELRPAIIPGWLIGGGVTLSFGLLFAAACAWAPQATWLLLVPLGALHWASQSYAASRAGLVRAEGLYQAVRILALSPEPHQAVPAFLEQVRSAFQAAAVHLVTSEADSLGVEEADSLGVEEAGSLGVEEAGSLGVEEAEGIGGHETDSLGGDEAHGKTLETAGRAGFDPGPARQARPGLLAGRGTSGRMGADLALASAVVELGQARVTVRSGVRAIVDGLARRGWRDGLVARVPVAGGTRRVLCVYDPKGVVSSDEADLAALSGLARELGGVLGRAEVEAALRSSEERFRALVQEASDTVVVVDAEGVAIDVMPSASAPPIRLAVGTRIADAAHPDDAAHVAACLGRVVSRPGSSGSFTWRADSADSADGSWHHLETTATNLLHAGAVDGVVLHVRDVTARVRATSLVSGQADVLGTISRRRPLSETVEALARATRVQAPGARLTVVLADESGGAVEVLGAPLALDLVSDLAGSLAGRASRQGHRAQRSVVLPDAADQWAGAGLPDEVRGVWATPVERADRSGSMGFVVVHFADPRQPDEPDWRMLESMADLAGIAAETVASEARLVHQATHDGLTGLPNRVLFLDRTDVALARLARTVMSVAVLFLDLDRFKTVNDSLGHDVGDQLLIALARRLEAVMRPSDTVARFGGDEFTILCTDITDQHEAAAIATRVRAVLAVPVVLEGHQLYVTASVGIAHTSDGGRVAKQLVEEADAAMYRAKRSGGDVHRVYDVGVRERALFDIVTYEGLRRAIHHDELRLHYQTTVDLRSGRIVGLEALVRWDHPRLGLVAPDDFIPLAEETGLIVPLGAVVLKEACLQRRRWEASGYGPDELVMSVNLSARQFADPGLADSISDALSEGGVSPSGLAFEITESALMGHTETTLATLRTLKELGVGLVIDDFGTGYSSLTYLKRFAADVVKLDKSFVEGLGSDHDDDAIVAGIINMAHTLGMITVAEGVETDAQVAVLRDLRCDVAQGYRFSFPVPADQVAFGASTIDLR